MPYPKPFVRLTWLLGIANSDEVAETGVNISTLGTAPFDAPAFTAALTQANGLALAGYYTTMMASNSHLFEWAVYSEFRAVKAADRTTADLETAAPFIWNSPQPYDHGTLEDVLPQASVVLSLRSGGTFGQANYGRMFLPHTGPALQSGQPFIAPASTALMAAAARTFLNSVNTLCNTVAAGSGIVNISKVGSGTVKGVSSVMVGGLIDTQRRRRNRLTEAYSTSVL